MTSTSRETGTARGRVASLLAFPKRMEKRLEGLSLKHPLVEHANALVELLLEIHKKAPEVLGEISPQAQELRSWQMRQSFISADDELSVAYLTDAWLNEAYHYAQAILTKAKTEETSAEELAAIDRFSIKLEKYYTSFIAIRDSFSPLSFQMENNFKEFVGSISSSYRAKATFMAFLLPLLEARKEFIYVPSENHMENYISTYRELIWESYLKELIVRSSEVHEVRAKLENSIDVLEAEAIIQLNLA